VEERCREGHRSHGTTQAALACCSSARLNARAAAAADTILLRSASVAALDSTSRCRHYHRESHTHASPLGLFLVHFHQILEITHKFPVSTRHATFVSRHTNNPLPPVCHRSLHSGPQRCSSRSPQPEHARVRARVKAAAGDGLETGCGYSVSERACGTSTDKRVRTRILSLTHTHTPEAPSRNHRFYPISHHSRSNNLLHPHRAQARARHRRPQRHTRTRLCAEGKVFCGRVFAGKCVREEGDGGGQTSVTRARHSGDDESCEG